jgi:hypothetical protein
METDIVEPINKITEYAHRIYEGVYENNEELIRYTDPDNNPEEIALLAETFSLMAVKLEAREIHLENQLQLVKQKNKELQNEMTKREHFGFIFIVFTIFLTIYTFAVAYVSKLPENLLSIKAQINSGVNIGFSIILVVIAVLLIKRTKFPLAEFGINFNNWRKSISESMQVTILVMILISAVKLYMMFFTESFRNSSFFNLNTIDWTFMAYAIVAPVQEFIARGVFQSSVNRFILIKNQAFWSITLTAMIFGLVHSFYSLELSAVAVITSYIWGWLYFRTPTLLGISLSHFILGNFLILLDLWQFFVK